MSLPTGGLIARSTIAGASRISRTATLALLACAWAAGPSPATAQPLFGASDSGFTAFSDNGAPLASPDIAIGDTTMLAVSSGEIAWYDKNNQLIGSLPLTGAGGLWDRVLDPGDIKDAQVVWNSASSRYYVVAIAKLDDGQTYTAIAFSQPGNPSNEWSTRYLATGEISRLSVGVYQTGVYTVYDYATGQGCWYLRIPEDQLLDTNWMNFSGGKLSGYPKEYACNDTGGVGDVRMIVASAESAMIDRIRIAAENPNWAGGPRVGAWIDVPWQSQPPEIDQPLADPIDNVDMEFRAVAMSGDSCWVAQTIGKGDHAIVRWYEIELNGWPTSGQAPTLRQTGDIDPGPGVHAFLPDIAVDSDGNAAIVFSISSATENIPLSIARAVRFVDDPLGTFQPHRIIKDSSSAVTSGAWGAYVGIEADPVTPGVFWSHAPYHDGGWKTWVGKITLAGDDVPPSDGPSLYSPDDGFINNIIPVLRWDFNELPSGFRVSVSTDAGFQINTFTSDIVQGNTYEIPEGVLDCNTRYYWRVVAETPEGDMMSNPDSRWFERRSRQDLNRDGIVDSADLGAFIAAFQNSDLSADFNGDGIVNSADLGGLIGAFGDVCN